MAQPPHDALRMLLEHHTVPAIHTVWQTIHAAARRAQRNYAIARAPAVARRVYYSRA